MEKVELPIKTKIIAYWMMILGGALIPCSGLWFFSAAGPSPGAGAIALLGSILLFSFGLCYFLSGLFTLKRKTWAWWLMRINLWIIMGGGIVHFVWRCYDYFHIWYPVLHTVDFITFFYYALPFLIFFPFFILLEFDRKNFWKIAS